MISLLVPTRGRPANVRRMVSSALDTADGTLGIEFVFRTDDDDKTGFPAEISQMRNVTVLREPRDTLSNLWNDAWSHARGDIFMQGDDEMIFRTDAWDAAVEEAFRSVPDRIAFVHGRDGHQADGTFGTLGFLHRNWADAVGYFTPPFFSCDYGDTWLNDVANDLDRRFYLPEVFTEHMHPVAGKAEWDDTHLERVQRGQRDDVGGLYASLAWKRQEDADKLRAVMGVRVITSPVRWAGGQEASDSHGTSGQS